METVAWTCVVCGATRDKPEKRLPRGWKKLADDVYCNDCWTTRYVLRAITMQVVSPVAMEWKELRDSLKQMWIATTQASNWMMTELYARDIRRLDEEKMPPMARVYLYPEARARYPQIPSQSVAALEQRIQLKYRSVRYKVVWTSQMSLPTFRFPTPFAVPNQGWAAYLNESDAPCVSLRVGEKRIDVRLKGGPGFRRQRRAFEQIIRGDAIKGELALYQSGKDLLCKLVAWLPRPKQSGERSGVLRVRTAADSLLIAVNEKDEALWTYNADHIRRWIAEHTDQLQRWSEDAKYEQRPVPTFAERRKAAVEKQHNRMGSAIQMIAAQLVGYAARRKFAGLYYDDSDQTFAEKFPWYQLRERIATNCDEHGLEFQTATSGEVTPESGEPLAVE